MGLSPIYDHGLLSGLADDDHLQYLLLSGRVGGQTAYGGPAAGNQLRLQGSSAADRGNIFLRGATNIDFDWTTDNNTYAIRWAQTIPASGGVIAGLMQVQNNVTINNALFISSTVDDVSTLEWIVSPGFAVSTLFFARPTFLTRTGGVAPAQAFIYAAQAQYWNNGAGDVTTTNYRAFSFAPIIRTESNGDRMRLTNTTGLIVNPLYNTRNANSTADFGTIRGLHMVNAGVILFGQALGAEIATGWIGLDVEALTGLTVSGRKAAVRSAIGAGTNNRFLENLGGAISDFGAGSARFNDNAGVVLGTGQDVSLIWNGSVFSMDPAVGEDLFFAFGLDGSKPTYLFEAETFGDSETDYTQIRFGFDRYAFGQVGSIGNQVGLFVAPNRTADVAGGWSDYLLTQAGSLNIGTFAMSDVAAWTLNSVSLDNTAGSIASLDTLVIGGMTTSNPGITVTERSALRVSGRFKQRGSIQYPPINPSALSAGNNNNWAGLLTGSPNNNGRYWARVSGNATTSVITGIDATAVQDGDSFSITNISSEVILLVNEDALSSAANRIIIPGGLSYPIDEDQTIDIRYDATSSRWRLLTPPAAVLPLSSIWKYDNTTTMADPGIRFFRLNNLVLGTVTAIAISVQTFKDGDATNFLGALAAGDKVIIQRSTDKGQFLVFTITGTTDNTTWFQIDGSAVDSGDAFTDNAEFGVIFVYA